MPLPFSHIACVDFETYYDSDYSLKKIPSTDYIRDDRFEAQACAIKIDDGTTEVHVGAAAIAAALRAVDWSTTAILCHHTQFDGLILTHHFGVYPCFWLDTMSMARALLGTDISVALKALCDRLGRPGKVHGQALVNVLGVRLADMTTEQLDALIVYNGDDVEDTRWLFDKFEGLLPDTELQLIDITIRMYVEPILLIDGARVEKAYHDEIARKAALFEQCGIDVKTLGSAEKFAAQLQALGVDPPKKVSFRTGKVTYAFAKGDYEFKALLAHEDEKVRWLVEARLASKSSLVETRSATIMGRTGRPTPVYLNYFGARTGRWSGGDGVNWQNLPKFGIGGELRRSLMAPAGCKLVVSDASQIEARTLAWHAGEQEVLDSFARGDDRYCVTAEDVYHRPINKHDDPNERQVGKTLELGEGFGAGAAKINYMLKIGAMGPPVHQSLDETADAVREWRRKRVLTVQHWKTMYTAAVNVFLQNGSYDDGVIAFERYKNDGFLHLPNGTFIRYPSVYVSDQGDLSYIAKNGPVKLWGGQIVENCTQALARAILGQQMIWMQEEMTDMRIATTTHDEVVAVVPAKNAADYASRINRIMSTNPDWTTGLPLNAQTDISDVYQKS